jgi:CheY-like chemotaxis protein
LIAVRRPLTPSVLLLPAYGLRARRYDSPVLPRILLVDDDGAALFALRELLSDLDAKLVLAATGEEALRQVLKQQFAAILLDVRLPGMDGFEVATAIRSLERSRRTPIIFMSAHADRRRQTRATAVHEFYLSKPLDPYLLRQKLAKLIEEAKTQVLPQGDRLEYKLA